MTLVMAKKYFLSYFSTLSMIALSDKKTGKPLPGTAEEISYFRKLQEDFVQQYRDAFPDKLAPKTIVVIPSLTLDQEILEKISGYLYYEERLLCLLMLLRMPNTNIIYLTSVPIDPVIIDYYLHLLPGITGYHALRRLKTLSCHDSSAVPLTQKVLQRPLLVDRIKKNIPANHAAHMVCFNVTALERTLAVQLDIPVFGCDPDLYSLGMKSGSRELFRTLGIDLPDGKEQLHSKEDIIQALYELKMKNPGLRRAILKMDEGFSGDGNAIFNYNSTTESNDLRKSIEVSLEQDLIIVAENLDKKTFFEKFNSMGGIAEAFIEGEIKSSPSVQCRLNPTGTIDVISTHDQVLGGNHQQVFLGATFPANPEYSIEIAEIAGKIAREAVALGVIGRLGVDFISVKENNRWKHYAIEINIRKGGTTHPYLMLQFLTDGHYQADKGKFYTANGQERFYFATDNVKVSTCKGLVPADLIDIAMQHDLLYDGTTQEGIMFHMISALSQYGKMGMVCIGNSLDRSLEYYKKAVAVLEFEGSRFHP